MCKGSSVLPSSCLERAKGMKLKFSHLAEKQDWTHHRRKSQEDRVLQDLDSLLNSEMGQKAFRGFLHSEFSGENLEFWLACEDYRVSPSHLQGPKASSICSEFINTDAPKEVNLNARTRDALLGEVDRPSVDTFRSAQQEIYNLMAKDSFPRFLRSPQYSEAVRTMY